MWFLGSLAVIAALALLCWWLGAGLLAQLHRPAPLSHGAAPLATLCGAAVLMLALALLSGVAGLPMRGWGPALALLLAACALPPLRRAGLSRDAWRSPAALALFWLVPVLLALYPLARHASFHVLGDPLASVGLAEYLQDHGFGPAVRAEVQSPVAGIVWLYQQRGYRMGPHYLLAFMQSLAPGRRAIDLFPASAGFGVLLAGTGLLLCARAALRASRWGAGAALAVAGAGYGALTYSADWGFMNQLYGLAFLYGGLAAWGRHFALPRSPSRFRAAIPAALLAVALAVAYSELLPVLGLAGTLALAWRAAGAGAGRRALLARAASLLLALSAASLFALRELLRAAHALAVQWSNVVGNPLADRIWDFAAFWAGVHPGPALRDAPAAAGLSAVARALIPLAHGLLALALFAGAARLARSRWRAARARELIAAGAVLLGLALWFRFGAADPWTAGARGNSWSLGKVVLYAAPLASLLAAAGWSRLGRRAGLLLAAGATLALLPLRRVAARAVSSPLRAATGEARPFSALEALARRANAEAGTGSVEIRHAEGGNCLRDELAAYYLYPRPVASPLWDAPGCVYFGPYEGSGFLAPPAPYALTLVGADDPLADGDPYPAGFVALRGDSPLSLTLDDAWYPREFDAEKWWNWARGGATLALETRRATPLVFSGSISCIRPSGRVALSLDGAPVGAVSCASDESPFSFPLSALTPGAHTLRLEPDFPPGAGRAGDMRVLSFALGRPRLRSSAGTEPFRP